MCRDWEIEWGDSNRIRPEIFMSKIYLLLLVLIAAVSPCSALKDTPFQTVDWPQTGQPMVRFTFSKFKLLTEGVGKEHGYITDATAENLSDKAIANLNLALYVFDKTKARIGDGDVRVSNVPAGQTVKFEITLYAAGVPASLSLAAKETGPRTISITINSIPQGATLRVDGKDAGTTPKIVEVTLGKHMLDFSKDGFSTGHFPLEMGPRDTNGGSVSYELGAASHDTIELRDGSVLSGDLISISGMEVQIRVGGTTQTYDRNQIKRILLTQRDPVPQ
jgi:hypothetical protein